MKYFLSILLSLSGCATSPNPPKDPIETVEISAFLYTDGILVQATDKSGKTSRLFFETVEPEPEPE